MQLNLELSGVKSIIAQHLVERNELVALSGVQLEPVKKSTELIVEADQDADSDDVKLYLRSLVAQIKSTVSQLGSPNLFSLSLSNLEGNSFSLDSSSTRHGFNT